MPYSPDPMSPNVVNWSKCVYTQIFIVRASPPVEKYATDDAFGHFGTTPEPYCIPIPIFLTYSGTLYYEIWVYTHQNRPPFLFSGALNKSQPAISLFVVHTTSNHGTIFKFPFSQPVLWTRQTKESNKRVWSGQLGEQTMDSMKGFLYILHGFTTATSPWLSPLYALQQMWLRLSVMDGFS